MKQQIGRLALRHEGKWWKAYFAEPGTMKDAVLIGTIRMSACEASPAAKAQFQASMTSVVADMVEQVTGKRPVMLTQTAPEHERAGHA